jgi:hypothetical protein
MIRLNPDQPSFPGLTCIGPFRSNETSSNRFGKLSLDLHQGINLPFEVTLDENAPLLDEEGLREVYFAEKHARKERARAREDRAQWLSESYDIGRADR